MVWLIRAVETPITTRLAEMTLRPPYRSKRRPIKGWEIPFTSQPTAMAADISPRLHSRSSVMGTTKTDKVATAMTVLGPDEGMAFAKDHELAVFFIVRTDKGVEELSTPAFDAIVEGK